jgi:hypothetical protein
MREGSRIAVKELKIAGLPTTIDSSSKGKKKSEDLFAIIPLWWAVLAAEATKTPAALVYIYLQHLGRMAKGRSFSVPNGWLEKQGVSRWTKHRVLRALESYKMIAVEWRHGKNPLVTMLPL